MTAWQAAGFAPQLGGRHPGGTVNALIRGPQFAYLELISAADRNGDAATRRVAATRGPVGWALGVDDIEGVRADLIAAGHGVGPVRSGSRTTPTGEVLAWRLCDIAAQPLDPVVPFLIQWDVGMPSGPVDGPRITGLVLGTPDRDGTAALLIACGLVRAAGGATEGSTTAAGDRSNRQVAISDGSVSVTLRTGAPGVQAVILESDDVPQGTIDIDGLRVECSAASLRPN
jgi:hypothetical protein